MIISQGYDVSAISSLHFDKVQAEEFYEVYKGVVPEYADHVVQVRVHFQTLLIFLAAGSLFVFGLRSFAVV
jgi:nucleoside diphosphate kinase